MLYIIGLGLNSKGISVEGIEAVKKCNKIYFENYTAEIPYSVKEIEKIIGKKLGIADRNFVESEKIFADSKKQNIALLIYGSPLFATTHISLIEEAKKHRIKYKIIYNASVFDALGETGLQLYKFGKITSLPKWDENKNFKPVSFVDAVQENQKINAHTLILVDINMEFEDAIEQLTTAVKGRFKLNKIIVCSKLGTENKKIIYDKIDKLKKRKIEAPFCFVIPGKLNFKEKEFLKNLS